MSNTDPNKDKDLTQEQIFSRMSKALRSGDVDALEELTSSSEEIKFEPEEEEVSVLDNLETPEVAPEVAASPEPVETPEVPETPAPQPTPSASAPAGGLSDEDKEELQRLRRMEQAYRSEMGRAPYLQRKIAELEKQLATKGPSHPSVAKAGAKDTSSINAELENVLGKIKEVDPVTAQALELIRQESLGAVKTTQSELKRRDEETHMEREYNRLLQKVPQAPQVFQLPEWQEWKASIPPQLLNLAESSNADDVYWAMERFAEDMKRTKPQLFAQPQAAPVAAVAAPEAPKPVASPAATPEQVAIEEQRTRRLQATTPASKAPVAPNNGGLPEDEKALFSHYYGLIRKKDNLK